MTKEQLAKRIRRLALLRGEFTLRSGRKSNYYLDKYRFETQPDVLKALGKMLAERVTPDIDRLAGPRLGAVPPGGAGAPWRRPGRWRAASRSSSSATARRTTARASRSRACSTRVKRSSSS